MVVGLLAGDVVKLVLPGLPPPGCDDLVDEYGGISLDDGLDVVLALAVVVGNGGAAVVVLSPPERENETEDKGYGDAVGGEVLLNHSQFYKAGKIHKGIGGCLLTATVGGANVLPAPEDTSEGSEFVTAAVAVDTQGQPVWEVTAVSL